MMKRLLLFLFVFLPIFPSLAQERILFSKAVEENIREYSKKSNAAYYYQNIERAKFLFDSIIDNVVKGSYMDNFEIILHLVHARKRGNPGFKQNRQEIS